MEARDFCQALVNAGLTQTRIQELTEIPQTTVSKILRGETQDVLSRTYRRLEALYKDVCLGGAEQPPAPAAAIHDAEGPARE